MKLLNGAELAGFIKERQARAVKQLERQLKRPPKLAIIQTGDNQLNTKYAELKQAYGEDIGIEVDFHSIKQSEIKSLISQLNSDASVDGIIIQLPLEDITQTDEIVSLIEPAKDIDALGKKSKFDQATPTAILWLLSGYNIDLADKKILIIGRGRLVGSPLSTMLDKSSIHHKVVDDKVEDLKTETLKADIIISATGQPGLLRPDMIKQGAVVVDAGTAVESGKQVGDVAPEVYERQDLTVTPARGGVGPLTICALFENLIMAARK